MFVQATIAILILVGFESVTAMGGEAKNAKRDIPIAVIVSLLVQGVFCYLIEYFAANYFLNSGYPMTTATGSAAPIGDMMIIVGDAVFGPGNGRIFMLVEAFTVFLAIIGTTLSCMNTGARVTYAMGKDQEVPEHFGMLHSDNLTPHRAIWTLAAISAVIGCLAIVICSAMPARWRTRDQGVAPGLLVEFRLHSSRPDGGAAQFAAHHHTGFQFRHVPALHAELHHLHRRISQPSEFQTAAALGDSGLRIARQFGLHGVLYNRAVHGFRNQDGAIDGFGHCARLGDLRWHLLHSLQQGHRANHTDRKTGGSECSIELANQGKA